MELPKFTQRTSNLVYRDTVFLRGVSNFRYNYNGKNSSTATYGIATYSNYKSAYLTTDD